jgi:hypothetical protein
VWRGDVDGNSLLPTLISLARVVDPGLILGRGADLGHN